MIHEREDGDSTINWIVSQEWSSGIVGMLGASYLGYVQWAFASSGNKHLKALVSIVTSGSPFIDIPRKEELLYLVCLHGHLWYQEIKLIEAKW